MQTLYAKTNQYLDAQNIMSAMVANSTMQADCEHCMINDHIFLNCISPTASVSALFQMSTLFNTSRNELRTPFNHVISHFDSYSPELFIKPPKS